MRTLTPRRAVLAAGVAIALSTIPATTAGAAGTTNLVPWEGSTWKVLDQGQDVSSTFAAPSYDTSTWKTYTVEAGKVLGYGDSDDQAPALTFGPSSSNKYPTTYLRTSFDVTDPSTLTDLTFNYLRDDGIIVYVNGQEVFRSNMAASGVTYSSYSSTTVDGADERALHTDVVPATALVAGQNVVAVELHQRSASSSDIALKMSVDATVADPVDAPASGSLPVIAGLGVVGVAALGVGSRRRARARA